MTRGPNDFSLYQLNFIAQSFWNKRKKAQYK